MKNDSEYKYKCAHCKWPCDDISMFIYWKVDTRGNDKKTYQCPNCHDTHKPIENRPAETSTANIRAIASAYSGLWYGKPLQ
jgi:Zn finger protein HypA/HybF involved in hydrogenase expression